MSRNMSTLTTARRLTAAGGGLMLLLAPRDGRLLLQSPLRECYLLGIVLFVASAMLLLFKSYEPLGFSLVTVMTLSGLQILGSAGMQWIDSLNRGVPFDFQFSYYDIVCWGAAWFLPFLICVLIRLLARNEWDTPERRADFCRFFKEATVSFLFFYTVLFLSCFLFIRSVNLNGARVYNLTPLSQIVQYFRGMENGGRYLLGNLFFFTPLGFFLAVYRPEWKWWLYLMFGLLFSGGTEVLQYAFNCGVADIDDVILNVAGLLIGVGLKRVLDRLRAWMTNREEQAIQYLEYRQEQEKSGMA